MDRQEEAGSRHRQKGRGEAVQEQAGSVKREQHAAYRQVPVSRAAGCAPVPRPPLLKDRADESGKGRR
jgi:hypothetical protein